MKQIFYNPQHPTKCLAASPSSAFRAFGGKSPEEPSLALVRGCVTVFSGVY